MKIVLLYIFYWVGWVNVGLSGGKNGQGWLCVLYIGGLIVDQCQNDSKGDWVDYGCFFVWVLIVICIDIFGCRCLLLFCLLLIVICIGMCWVILMKLLVVLFGEMVLNFILVVGEIFCILLWKVLLLSVFMVKVIGWLMCILVNWVFLRLVIIQCCGGISEVRWVLVLIQVLRCIEICFSWLLVGVIIWVFCRLICVSLSVVLVLVMLVFSEL